MRKTFTLLLFVLLLASGSAKAFEADHGFSFKGFAKKPASELRVVWWNILQGGKLGEAIDKKEGHNPLQNNLEELTRPEQKPEFLVLGEYRPDDVKPEIDQLLKSRYQHALFFPYNSVYHQQGVLVLTDLHVVSFTSAVGWDDPNGTREENDSYRARWAQLYPPSASSFDRTFIAIEYQWNGEKHVLLPFHSIQPWMPIQTSFPAHTGKILTALEIITGTHNPLFYQLTRYFSIMMNYFNPSINKIVMIGDLNTPDNILGLTTIGYRLLTSTLHDAFQQGDAYTFPAPSSINTELSPGKKTINAIRIDHALASESVQTGGAIRIPLRGSDHFPIAVSIKN